MDLNGLVQKQNEKVAAIINNSIHIKRISELGKTKKKKLNANKGSHLVRDWYQIIQIKINGLHPDNPNVKKLFDKLVDLALNNPEPVKAAVYGTIKVDEEPVEEENYFVQRCQVQETSNSGKKITKYKVELTGDYPVGTIITVKTESKNTVQR